MASTTETAPAPTPLATPSDLRPDQVEAITACVNRLIADAYALYVKTKNYHWHVSGSHFRGYHKLFDEHADAILASVDPLAERVRRIGGTTIHSLGHLTRLQTLRDDDADFVPAEDMITRLLADNRQVAASQREAVELCERNRDYPTSNILQDLLDGTEKRV